MKISGFIFWLWLNDLILRNRWLQVTSYPMLMNKKLECKDHQINSKISREICKKSLNFIRIIKNSSFFWPAFSIYMVQTLLKIIWWWFLVPLSERLLNSSAALLCKTWKISTFSMSVCYNTNAFFLKSFLLMPKDLSVFEDNFFILKFHCFNVLP